MRPLDGEGTMSSDMALLWAAVIVIALVVVVVDPR